MKHALTAVFLSLLLAAGAYAAQVPISEHRSVNPDALIEVELVAGTVRVTGWEKAEMELTGFLGDDLQKLEITGGKDRLKIEVRLPKGEHHDFEDSELVFHVPRGSQLSVDTVSGDITVSDMKGRLELNTVSGDLNVKGSPREVKLNSVSGDIKLDDGASLENADLNTVSGSIDAHLNFRSGGSFKFGTVSGNVSLRVPAKPSAEFEVSTFSGSITNDFGEEPVKKSSFLPAEELSFTLGSGGARVKVDAFSGEVVIRKE
jgi:DUF4097 and DUF4098 domain-containing protein YvlB